MKDQQKLLAIRQEIAALYYSSESTIPCFETWSGASINYLEIFDQLNGDELLNYREGALFILLVTYCDRIEGYQTPTWLTEPAECLEFLTTQTFLTKGEQLVAKELTELLHVTSLKEWGGLKYNTQVLASQYLERVIQMCEQIEREAFDDPSVNNFRVCALLPHEALIKYWDELSAFVFHQLLIDPTRCCISLSPRFEYEDKLSSSAISLEGYQVERLLLLLDFQLRYFVGNSLSLSKSRKENIVMLLSSLKLTSQISLKLCVEIYELITSGKKYLEESSKLVTRVEIARDLIRPAYQEMLTKCNSKHVGPIDLEKFATDIKIGKVKFLPSESFRQFKKKPRD